MTTRKTAIVAGVEIGETGIPAEVAVIIFVPVGHAEVGRLPAERNAAGFCFRGCHAGRLMAGTPVVLIVDRPVGLRPIGSVDAGRAVARPTILDAVRDRDGERV